MMEEVVSELGRRTGWWWLVVVCGVCGGRSREWSVGCGEGGGRVAEVMRAEVRWGEHEVGRVGGCLWR